MPFGQLSGLLLVVNREVAWHDEWPQVIPLRAAPVVACGVAAQSLMYLGPTDGWRLGGVLVSILVAGFTFFVIWRGRRRVHQHGPAPEDPVSVMLVVVLMALISVAGWQIVLRNATDSVPFAFVVLLGIVVSAAWYVALIALVNRVRSRRIESIQ